MTKKHNHRKYKHVTKKYELTETTIEFNCRTLHRIKALRDFADVKAGDLGGWIESEENLSHTGNAFVYGDSKVCDLANVSCDAKVSGNAKVTCNAKVDGDAMVFGDADVSGNAWVSDKAKVYGNSRVYDSARVFGKALVSGDSRVSYNAWVFGNACVFGNAYIFGNVRVRSNSDYIVFKNFWSSGRYFTWTRSNNMWKVGCFYGTGEELIKKAYADSERSGREYERVVRYVESILADEKKDKTIDI